MVLQGSPNSRRDSSSSSAITKHFSPRAPDCLSHDSSANCLMGHAASLCSSTRSWAAKYSQGEMLVDQDSEHFCLATVAASPSLCYPACANGFMPVMSIQDANTAVQAKERHCEGRKRRDWKREEKVEPRLGLMGGIGLTAGLQLFEMSINFVPQLLWVDLEMSGLDPLENRILEFACILTDSHLQYQQEGPHLVIHCDEEHLKTMDEWNTTHHRASGLYASCIASGTSLKQAEEQVIAYLLGLGVGPGQLTIAGNSVHMDKLFLFHHMPRLNQYLHYRILDVSSVKIVVNAIHPHLFFKKKNSHRALDDIRESIGELYFYMQYAFK